jgi:capsular polysaccharide biosynthesis protein
MSEEKHAVTEEKRATTGEAKRNHLYSFIVGIVIGLAIIVIFVLLFH